MQVELIKRNKTISYLTYWAKWLEIAWLGPVAHFIPKMESFPEGKIYLVTGLAQYVHSTYFGAPKKSHIGHLTQWEIVAHLLWPHFKVFLTVSVSNQPTLYFWVFLFLCCCCCCFFPLTLSLIYLVLASLNEFPSLDTEIKISCMKNEDTLKNIKRWIKDVYLSISVYYPVSA